MLRRVASARFSLVLIGLAFVLRALTPAGYMPASAANGLLYELCPDGLPPIIVQRLSGNGHHHHHAGGDSDSSAEDRCPVGHMLSSTIAAGDVTVVILSPVVPWYGVAATKTPIAARQVNYRSRAPPA